MNSGIAISQADRRPMYLQIIEQIRHRVASGDWASGHELPSIRALAVALKVSVITVKRAYLELERDGVIVTRQGRGSFVAEGADLGDTLQREELRAQLDAAVATAALIGLGEEELVQKLRAACRNLAERQR